MSMRLLIGAAATVALGAALFVAVAGPSAAKKTTPPKASVLVAKGKALVAQYRCNTCHGADLKGKPGFAPSLRANGVLKEYTPKTWATVLLTGVTNDGGKVKPPMPVYGMKAASSGAIWAYLETLH
jgi:mono/diheme cytochrome c family protein